MKLLRFFLLGVLLCAWDPCARADDTGGDIGLELLPKGRLFQPTFADPREIRMALTFEGDTRIDAMIGNYFSLLGIRPKNNDDWLADFGLEGAGYFTMRSEDSRFPLETADGLVGVYTELANGPWQYQLRYTHISAHLADGSEGITPIAYSREFLTARVGYVPSPSYQVYVGTHYLTHTIPLLPGWELQSGGSLFYPWAHTKLTPFVGLDLHWNQESDVTLSVSAQLGVALNNPPDAYHSFRFFYSYYSGADPRGQFYNRPLTMNSLGVEMQI